MNEHGNYQMQSDTAQMLRVSQDMCMSLRDIVNVLTTLAGEIKTLKVVTPEIATKKPVDIVAEGRRVAWQQDPQLLYADSNSRVVDALCDEVEHLRAENVELKAEIYALWQTDHEMEFGGEG